jgi:hypothetical protein
MQSEPVVFVSCTLLRWRPPNVDSHLQFHECSGARGQAICLSSVPPGVLRLPGAYPCTGSRRCPCPPTSPGPQGRRRQWLQRAELDETDVLLLSAKQLTPERVHHEPGRGTPLLELPAISRLPRPRLMKLVPRHERVGPERCTPLLRTSLAFRVYRNSSASVLRLPTEACSRDSRQRPCAHPRVLGSCMLDSRSDSPRSTHG